MRIVLLLALLTVSECGSSRVVGGTGQNITPPCKYVIKYYKERPICWNRGELPYEGCDKQLIGTGAFKGKEETSDSSRYQLLGRLDEGDVSLTILNLTETDAGRYGCRVEIPGLFNDEKHHFDLTVEKDVKRDVTQVFIGNLVRLSLIIFIPAVLMAAGYRVWSRRQTSDRRTNQSEEQQEDDSSSV